MTAVRTTQEKILLIKVNEQLAYVQHCESNGGQRSSKFQNGAKYPHENPLTRNFLSATYSAVLQAWWLDFVHHALQFLLEIIQIALTGGTPDTLWFAAPSNASKPMSAVLDSGKKLATSTCRCVF